MSVLRDATNPEPKSQKTLKRLEPEDREAVELMLADCAARLLHSAGHWSEDEVRVTDYL